MTINPSACSADHMRSVLHTDAVDRAEVAESKNLYNTLVMLGGFLDRISPGHQWKSRLRQLITDHRIPETEMGFPPHWQVDPFWQTAMEQP